ncbi:MAG: hypothetical protein LBK52_04420, partial [Deltaproteobacteria bacterium]|nr:hypothetical protein [Deltaproteobacteria bacterium]
MTAETQFSETPAESFSPDGSLSPDGSPGLFPVSRNNGLLLAAAGGLAQAATLPKLGAWPLVFLCLIPLYWAIRSQPLRRAFLFGWVYGLALGLGSFYWLAEVMAGYGGLGAGGFVVLLLLAAFMALHQALWAWLTAPWVRTGNLGLTGPLAGAF